MQRLKKLFNFPQAAKYIFKATVIIFLFSISFGAGSVFGYKGYLAKISEFPKVSINRDLPLEKKDLEFSLFWRVWDTLHAQYFDKSKIIDAKLVYGAISGMVSAVGDPYTVFLPPSENKIVQEDLQGNFEGVGIQIGFKKNQLVVMAPLPDSPAEEAGVMAGDLIIGIIDKNKDIQLDTAGITIHDAVQAIRGPANTTVTLVLRREGVDDIFDVDIVRKSIDVASVLYKYIDESESIVHVEILKFAGETLVEWNDVVEELVKNPNLKGIILDVRNNPGGFLEQAVELGSDFLETGEVVVIEEDGGGIKQEFRVEKLGRFRDENIVVLVNGGSASASEILAGALRDERGSKLVGEVTFGKGTIQESQQVDGNSGLHITIARWLTPSGFWVNDGGLVPDYEVEDNPETEEDEQLEKAIELFEN